MGCGGMVGVVEKESAKESGEEVGRVRPRPPRRMFEILCALKQHSHTPPQVASPHVGWTDGPPVPAFLTES